MATENIEVLIEGGKATAAPPLGPALGPMGVNIGQVVAEINKMTADFKCMKVPVTVSIDKETKKFTIKVGTPPAAQLIKQEAGVQKAAGNPLTEVAGNLTIEQVVKIANMKAGSLLGANTKAKAREIIGTCNAMGITVEGLRGKEALAAIDSGKFADKLN